jgi:hypothetical protein
MPNRPACGPFKRAEKAQKGFRANPQRGVLYAAEPTNNESKQQSRQCAASSSFAVSEAFNARRGTATIEIAIEPSKIATTAAIFAIACRVFRATAAVEARQLRKCTVRAFRNTTEASSQLGG